MIAALYAVAIAGLLLYGGHWGWLALVHLRAERLRDGPAPESFPENEPEAWPVVTVQLPLYNEAGVAERLLDACARIDYPKERLEIQVLDDSTDETTALVQERAAHWRVRGRDVTVVHRTDRTGYKAGALKNGLRRARGTLVAVFDADFIPPPDFLRRAVPALLVDEDVGMVQARWGHLNAERSALTKAQGLGLDAHFAIEQDGRQRAGCFVNFNGTAGLWRRTCIQAAGGWHTDTLTEDLDLSYRAQLAGWRLRYLPVLEVPAELPASLDALRAQQERWAQGAIETARKLLGPLWRSGRSLRVKVAGSFHLTAHLAYPLVLLAALTHPVLAWLKGGGAGPGTLYFAALSLGMLGFAGVFLAQLFAQRALYPDWARRFATRFPFFLAGTVGLALSNTAAVLRGLAGQRTPFARTPKTGDRAGDQDGRPWWRARYATDALFAGGGAVVWGEAALAAYSLAGLAVVAAAGEWAALPFQALFAAGFGLVAGLSLRQAQRVRAVATG
jgi:cellulose synthase/poly-beta-1,6-N-acetylglucosamine synthase-like glycosyltransferase